MQRPPELGKNDLQHMLPRNLKVCILQITPQINLRNTSLLTESYLAEPAVIAKSNIILDVKPWDDETDMKEMETEVRKIETKGLLWGACKFSFLYNIF